MKALQIAATGMKAQEQNVEVISNNVANMRTTGFKKQRADFQDLLYQNLRRMGTETSDAGTIVPTGVQIGSGVKLASTARIMSQGSLEQTDDSLDIAIRGEGFFQIDLPDGTTGYTRDGSFERDADGQLVTVDGYTVNPG
ncbi:MAG: flagellar hook-basal body complex protein, partial [Pseudomonadota bacterium]